MKRKNIIFLLIFINIISKLNCNLGEDETQIEITSEMQMSEILSETENMHLFSATFDKSQGKFIFLLLKHKNYEDEYNHIYVTIPYDQEKIPTYKNSDYKTVDKNTTLLIETSKIAKTINNARITIECKDFCDFILYYQIVTNIPLIDDRSFDLILNPNEEFVLEYELESLDELNNKFTFFSNAPCDFTLKIFYNDTEEISPLTDFYNGYGLFVSKEKYPDGGRFLFKVNHYEKPNELIHISNRRLTKEIKNLAVGDFHNSITGIEDLEEECFNLPKISAEENDKNYNLNFITYTKNILITLDNKDTFIIDSESDVIQIDAKKYSEICFSSSNGKIATTTFQILDGTEQTLHQDQQMPLYRGVPKRAKLIKGQIAYYRLYFYPSYSINLIMNLRAIEGKAKLYYGVCTNYPNCGFQEDQVKGFETQKDINNNIFIKKEINENMTKPYSDPEFQVAIVYCTNENNEKDCEYFITLLNDNDQINIIENEKYYSSVKNYETDKYQFNIDDSNEELNYLFINLYSYTGQGNLAIYSDKEMTKEINKTVINAVQNQQIAVIIPEETLAGNYYISIKGLSNTIYSIYYYTTTNDSKLTEYYLLSNEVNIKSIKPNNEDISFLIKNRAIHKKIPFLFEYNSLNCELEVSLTGESETIKERNYQFIIDDSKSYYNKDYYEMKIKATNPDIEGDSSLIECLVAITGGEIEQNKEILLSDGVIQKGKLTKKINFVNYLYTFMINSLNDEVSLFFQKDSTYIIDLSYGFENSDLITYKIYNNEKSLVFTKKDYLEHCIHYNESCSLKIQIKINEEVSLTDNSYLDFILSINNKITYPSYMPKVSLVRNILQTNQYQYYYLDIGKNEECDIFLDFNEGFGQAIAKIVRKDITEENSNYNRRVILPISGMKENYIFDQYTKQLKITKDMTSKCEKGCEIYIGIFHIDQRFTDYISTFNLYYRKNNNIVYVPENLFINGNLNSIDDKNIFRTKINKKTDIVIFNLVEDHTSIFINKGENVPTSDLHDYIIDSEDKKQLMIKSDSFEGQIFTYVVSTNKLENKYYRKYNFKIDTPYSEALNIKYIDYLHNNPCYFNKDNQKCHYILPVENYNKEDKLYLYTPDNKNTLIYANYIMIEEFDSLNNEEKSKKLPKKLDSSKNYLIIDISGRKKEIYILITVEVTDVENESFANLIVGEYYHASTSFLRPNTYSFYSLTGDNIRNTLNLAFESHDLYSINFIFLSGNNAIITESEIDKNFEFSVTNKMLTFLFDLKKQKSFYIDFESHNNINADDDEICFYTYLELTSNLTNIVEVKNNDISEQKFEFLKNEQLKGFFPLSFYELEQKDTTEEKRYIFKVFDRKPSDSSLKEKKLIIEGYILNKTTIEDIKINPNILQKENKLVTGEYDNNYLFARINFTKEIIEKYSIYEENYFYINLRTSNEEIIEFDYMEIDLLKSLFNYIYMNKYMNFKIQGKESKNLLLVPEPRVSKMAIDFLVDGKSDLDNYDISVKTYYEEDTDYSKNDTYLIDHSYTFRKDEKQYIMLFINPSIHYIVADVIKKNYNNINDEIYILKYRIEDAYPIYYYLGNRTIKKSLNETKLNLEFKGVKECEKGCTYHDDFEVIYYIKFYDKEKLGDIEIKNILVDENPIYEKKITKNGLFETINETLEIEEYNGKYQLVQISASASYGENEEIFAYEVFTIQYKKNEEQKKNRNFEFYIILACFVGIVIITFIAMYVYIYAKMEIGRKTLMLNNPNISLIQRPSDRSSGNTRTTV